MAGRVACGDVVARGIREGTADEGHAFYVAAQAECYNGVAENPLAVAVFIGCGDFGRCEGERGGLIVWPGQRGWRRGKGYALALGCGHGGFAGCHPAGRGRMPA